MKLADARATVISTLHTTLAADLQTLTTSSCLDLKHCFVGKLPFQLAGTCDHSLSHKTCKHRKHGQTQSRLL